MVSFRQWLGLGSAKRLEIYALSGLPLKNTSLKGIFWGLPRPWKPKRLVIYMLFWALVKKYLFERPFLALLRPWKPNRLVVYLLIGRPLKNTSLKKAFSGAASALDAPNGS